MLKLQTLACCQDVAALDLIHCTVVLPTLLSKSFNLDTASETLEPETVVRSTEATAGYDLSSELLVAEPRSQVLTEVIRSIEVHITAYVSQKRW